MQAFLSTTQDAGPHRSSNVADSCSAFGTEAAAAGEPGLALQSACAREGWLEAGGCCCGCLGALDWRLAGAKLLGVMLTTLLPLLALLLLRLEQLQRL